MLWFNKISQMFGFSHSHRLFYECLFISLGSRFLGTFAARSPRHKKSRKYEPIWEISTCWLKNWLFLHASGHRLIHQYSSSHNKCIFANEKKTQTNISHHSHISAIVWACLWDSFCLWRKYIIRKFIRYISSTLTTFSPGFFFILSLASVLCL